MRYVNLYFFLDTKVAARKCYLLVCFGKYTVSMSIVND